MGRWTDLAQWVGPTPNTNGAIADHMYVVVHIADGSYDGTIAWQKNPAANVSSHFIVARDGRIAQMLDTAAKAWTQIQGNPYSISIENEGRTGQTLTDAQVDANARILLRAHREYGIPLQLTGRVGTRGLGHHSMGAESGVDWGHSQCPGEPIKAQKPAILARALALQNGDDMPLTQQEKDEIVYRTATIVLAGIQPAGYADVTAPEPYKGQLAQALKFSGQHAAEQLVALGAAVKEVAAKVSAPPAVDVQALADALAAHLNIDQAAVVAALKSPEGQAALVQADNTAEDS